MRNLKVYTIGTIHFFKIPYYLQRMKTVFPAIFSSQGNRAQRSMSTPLRPFHFQRMFREFLITSLFLTLGIVHPLTVTASSGKLLPSVERVSLIHLGNTTKYTTIQSAIDNAVDGDEIVVEAGTFREQLTITKGITIRGEGAGATILEAPNAADLVQSGTDWKNLKGQDVYAIVGIRTVGDATVKIRKLTIDGRNQGYLDTYPDKNSYTFQGIGVKNSNVTVDSVTITQVRGLETDYDPGHLVPSGYLPEEQPSGMNHHEAIATESEEGGADHLLRIKHCTISKFQKTGILAWGPTQVVDIDSNAIEGIGQTLWSTGNAIQIASTVVGGVNRTGTKGSVTNNTITGIGIVIPPVGEDGHYVNLDLGGSTGILLYQAGANFVIRNNTITRTYAPSWRSDQTSYGGGYANQGIVVNETVDFIVENNEISGFDVGISEEKAVVGSKASVMGNRLSSNTIDINLLGGQDLIELREGVTAQPEIVGVRKGKHGIDLISGFGPGDQLYVFDLVDGTINGYLNSVPVIDLTTGTIGAGDGSSVGPYSMQLTTTETLTTLYINTTSAQGPADVTIKLEGSYLPNDFILDQGYVKFNRTVVLIHLADIHLYSSIAEAIAHAVDGDKVVIGEGTFTEQLTIQSGITLSGMDEGQTIIRSPKSKYLVQSGDTWKNMKNQDVYAVVGIRTANDAPVLLERLTVDGRNQGYLAQYPDKNSYAFQGIGVRNSNVTVDQVTVTRVRELETDYDPTRLVPAGYLPTDQPAGMNHNESIASEGALGATPHTLVVKNSTITKFQKTGIQAWGPTQVVDITNNTIQGYGQTLWSTGNGIQISSSVSSEDRRGTTGSITNNQILDIGIVIPPVGNEGYYLNLGLGGSSGILVWEGGDGLTISGNTITRTLAPSWQNDIITKAGGYANQGIAYVDTPNMTIENNTVSGFDAGIFEQSAVTGSISTVRNNTLSNNILDITLHETNDIVELAEGLDAVPETIGLKKGLTGVDQIKGFGIGDRFYVFDIPVGTVNGILEGHPVIDFTGGKVKFGDGTNVLAKSAQVSIASGVTTLHINTTSSSGAADIQVKLTGVYYPGNFVLDSGYVRYNCLGQWLGAESSDWNNPANWGCSTIPTRTTDVFIPGEADNLPIVNITDATCRDLTIYAGSALMIPGGKLLAIYGNAENNGTFEANGKTVFSGDSQTIPGGDYENLEIAGSGMMRLTGDIYVMNELKMTSGYLALGDHELLFSGLTGASASSFVITNGTGKLKRNELGDGAITDPTLFPVGTDSLSYTPLTLTNTGDYDSFGVRVGEGVNSSYDANEAPTGTAQTLKNVNKTWFVTEENSGGSDVTLTFQWNAGDEQIDFQRATCFGSHYKNGKWNPGTSGAASGTNPYTVSLSGITEFSPFGVGSTGGALPLNLLSFKAVAQEQNVSLTWQTINEVNTAGFAVEGAKDAVHFQELGYVSAQTAQEGVSLSYHYTLPHATQSGAYYYRLKMLDNDGKYSYSKIEAIRYSNKNSDYQLFSNPVAGADLVVKHQEKKNGAAQVKIIDLSGRVLYQSEVLLGASPDHFSIPVKNLLPGANYLLLITESQTGNHQALHFIKE